MLDTGLIFVSQIVKLHLSTMSLNLLFLCFSYIGHKCLVFRIKIMLISEISVFADRVTFIITTSIFLNKQCMHASKNKADRLIKNLSQCFSPSDTSYILISVLVNVVIIY